MFDSNKLQTEIFKKVLVRNTHARYSDDDGFVCFTADGYSAFRIPKNDVCIDLSKMMRLDNLKDHFYIGETAKEIKITKICEHTPKDMLIKLEGNGVEVWAAKRFIDQYYDDQRLYIELESTPIKFVSMVTDKVEAIVLPVLRR